MTKASLIFQPYGKKLDVTIGETIFEAAKEMGIRLESFCGGHGTCGKCRVIIRRGKESLSSLSGAEEFFLSKDELDDGFRLACQAAINKRGIIIVEIPYWSQLDQQRLLLEGLERLVKLKPSVKNFIVHLREPSLLDVRSDIDRLLDAVKNQIRLRPRIDYECLKKIPLVLREGHWTVTATLWMNSEIISVKPESPRGGVYGVAVDIGTTKLALYLVNLETSETLMSTSMVNPQISYGEDVISRISYIMADDENLERLHRVIIEGINRLIDESCVKIGITAEEIYDMTVVGNTAMHHIFLNIYPKYVALNPYPAALQSSINIKARELGITANRGAYVYMLPTVAGFVGGDAIGDIIATEIYKSDKLMMVIDIGTNTEIILGNRNRLIACSCASGPVFEGAHITYGMRAATGAIERIWIDPKTLEVRYQTIDNAKPRGLCGSAEVDILAEMIKAKIITSNGRFNPKLETERLRKNRDPIEFVIVRKDETAINNDIVVTQKDIREVQLAKAAIYTGTSILMRQMNITPTEIQKIMIAGAFGNYIDPLNARTIGMYPDVPLRRVGLVGNTAGSGARMALLSTKVRRLAEKVAREVQYIELGADPMFQEEFLKATYLPHKEIERFPSIMQLMKNN